MQPPQAAFEAAEFVELVLPPGVQAGQALQLRGPQGQSIHFLAPMGAFAGMRIRVEVPRVGNAVNYPRAAGAATLPQQTRGDSRVPPDPQLKELPPGWTRHVRIATGQRRYEYLAPDQSARAGSVADAWRRYRGERPAAGQHKSKATRPAGVLSHLAPAHLAPAHLAPACLACSPRLLASPARLACSLGDHGLRSSLLRGGDGRRSDGERRGGWTEWRRRGRRMGCGRRRRRRAGRRRCRRLSGRAASARVGSVSAQAVVSPSPARVHRSLSSLCLSVCPGNMACVTCC